MLATVDVREGRGEKHEWSKDRKVPLPRPALPAVLRTAGTRQIVLEAALAAAGGA